jgi:hypothetical protein
MSLLSKRYALIALSILALPLQAADDDSTAFEAAVPAVMEAVVPPGGVRMELGRVPSLYRQGFAAKDLAADSFAAATTLEVDLGATTAEEGYNELRQSVALLADGSYASVWTERTSNSSVDVAMQWVRPDGSKVFPGGGVYVANSSNIEFDTAVAPNPAGGGAFVAYARDLGGRRQVYVQSYDAAGNPRWAAGGVSVADVISSDFQEHPQLLAAPQGGVYVCMMLFHGLVSGTGDLITMLCQRLDANGRRLWTDAGVQAGGLRGLKILPKLVTDGRGGALVFWRNNRDPFNAPQHPILIEGQRLTPDGTRAWGTRGRILRTTNLAAAGGYSFFELSATSDGRGGAVLSFHDWRGQGVLALDVFAQRVNRAGRVLWGRGVPVAATGEPEQNDSITAAPDGGAFVTVWAPRSLTLWLHRLGPDGRVRWKRQLFAEDVGPTPNDWGAYGSFDQGRLRIAWIHQRQNGTWTMDVYYVIYDLDGFRLLDATPLTTAQDGQFLRGFAFDAARAQGFAVWEDRRKGTWEDLDTVGGLYKE